MYRHFMHLYTASSVWARDGSEDKQGTRLSSVRVTIKKIQICINSEEKTYTVSCKS